MLQTPTGILHKPARHLNALARIFNVFLYTPIIIITIVNNWVVARYILLNAASNNTEKAGSHTIKQLLYSTDGLRGTNSISDNMDYSDIVIRHKAKGHKEHLQDTEGSNCSMSKYSTLGRSDCTWHDIWWLSTKLYTSPTEQSEKATLAIGIKFPCSIFAESSQIKP